MTIVIACGTLHSGIAPIIRYLIFKFESRRINDNGMSPMHPDEDNKIRYSSSSARSNDLFDFSQTFCGIAHQTMIHDWGSFRSVQTINKRHWKTMSRNGL